ncbi:cell envelope integrity protein CreD [Alcanivorax profundi]|uniref:Cell envelope integrity protein CreD n=1 Tax=Alcanivorax profundi TaxID=2338368 RepID=A0A418XYW5_9GAMM|nr:MULTISPECIES: cell envelope integrity protein CreD [Alcanivorax]RJG18219.1 cell envelope integrity protein CreD [Alcanivorax profundi]
MRPNLLIKMLTIGGLMLVLVVPLLMIQGKISERESEAWQVGDQIARQISGEQQLGGPMIVVPRTVRSWSEKPDCEGSGCMTVRHHIELDSLIPDSLSLDGDMQTEMRYRGIYGVPVYRTLLHLEAVFPANWREPSSDARVVSSSSPLLLFQIRDLRGLVERPQVLVNDVPLALMEAEQLPKGVGTHAIAVALPDTLQGAFTVKIRLNLNGTQSFGMLPLAKETRMALRSDWPHPSFEGLVLPVEREISDAGFTSQWRTNSLAAASAIHCARGDAACGDADQALRVRLVQPVTGLLSSERALKYSFLIVGLTFAAFFLFEVLRRYPLHAMQYLLVGLSLAMFYMLLVALSEHIDFALAYACAALACCALIGVYLMAVMRSLKSGWLFAGSLLLVMVLIYGILMAEDYALLMGALLLFAALASVMLVTRKLDWYSFASVRKTGQESLLKERNMP